MKCGVAVHPSIEVEEFAFQSGVRFIRARVPDRTSETKLALLKLLMTEPDILSLMHDATSFDDFWKHIHGLCTRQFAMVSGHFSRVYAFQFPASR